MEMVKSSGTALAGLVLLIVCLSIIGSLLAATATLTSLSQPTGAAITSPAQPAPPMNKEDLPEDLPDEEEPQEEPWEE